ncbi:MAG: 1,4-dihydroxy-2-naphthoate polyprenyltransferase [Chthoniobacterales bacterium]|nr:1,4-dihydroxy-2-naphthoate polyprenyltransferase [Chthoniobacterales bacterium]
MGGIKGIWDCFGVWLCAIRPRTLHAAICPVCLGTAYAASLGKEEIWVAAMAMFSALFIQIGTNLANDYFDARQGADTEERLGPLRVTASGLIAPQRVFSGAVVAFGIAIIFGIPLVLRGGVPILLLGAVAIFCGIFYTFGRRSLAYVGLGDVFAFLFFGPVATAGTVYVQSLQFLPMAAMLGLVPGCYSLALIAVNNLRDAPMDRKAGKKTLAVRFGEKFGRMEIVVALGVACFSSVLIPLFWIPLSLVIVLMTGVGMASVVTSILRGASGAALNPLLGKIGRSHMITTTIWCLALLVQPRLELLRIKDFFNGFNYLNFLVYVG